MVSTIYGAIFWINARPQHVVILLVCGVAETTRCRRSTCRACVGEIEVVAFTSRVERKPMASHGLQPVESVESQPIAWMALTLLLNDFPQAARLPDHSINLPQPIQDCFP